MTSTGRHQAEQVAAAFAGPPALIVASPYVRASQTAEPTAARFPEVALEQWPVQEFTYLGDLHYKETTWQERKPYVEAYWERADPDLSIGGAESFNDLLGRVQAMLERLTGLAGPVAVFTHGHFIRAVVWSLLIGGDMRSFWTFTERYLVPNASVLELRFPGPRVIGAARLTPLW